MPIHSHYDHALDAAFVAQKTGAVLYGSASTANIGKGQGLPAEKIRTIKNREVLQVGKFKITVIESRHSPDAWYEGFIDEPLTPPQPASHYKMAECYSLLVEHEGKKILVHGSAGFIPGGLKDYKADVIYLGVGTLGRQDAKFQQDYWNEVVKTVGAQRVILVHWDDFFEPLSEPLAPLPWPLDDFKNTLSFVRERSKSDHVDVRIPILWNHADPFKDLPASP